MIKCCDDQVLCRVRTYFEISDKIWLLCRNEISLFWNQGSLFLACSTARWIAWSPGRTLYKSCQHNNTLSRLDIHPVKHHKSTTTHRVPLRITSSPTRRATTTLTLPQDAVPTPGSGLDCIRLFCRRSARLQRANRWWNIYGRHCHYRHIRRRWHPTRDICP